MGLSEECRRQEQNLHLWKLAVDVGERLLEFQRLEEQVDWHWVPPVPLGVLPKQVVGVLGIQGLKGGLGPNLRLVPRRGRLVEPINHVVAIDLLPKSRVLHCPGISDEGAPLELVVRAGSRQGAHLVEREAVRLHLVRRHRKVLQLAVLPVVVLEEFPRQEVAIRVVRERFKVHTVHHAVGGDVKPVDAAVHAGPAVVADAEALVARAPAGAVLGAEGLRAVVPDPALVARARVREAGAAPRAYRPRTRAWARQLRHLRPRLARGPKGVGREKLRVLRYQVDRNEAAEHRQRHQNGVEPAHRCSEATQARARHPSSASRA
mmetsp:Transcript_7129/g.17592  ORF Transcript_7129/g.17592 Transcript_7129/m.17592 type:complete len:320 (-) Transcript_7129:108-1067(-)